MVRQRRGRAALPVLQLSIERQRSEHPLCPALQSYGREPPVMVGSTRFRPLEQVAGGGVRANVGGACALAGNARLMEQAGVDASRVRAACPRACR